MPNITMGKFSSSLLILLEDPARQECNCEIKESRCYQHDTWDWKGALFRLRDVIRSVKRFFLCTPTRIPEMDDPGLEVTLIKKYYHNKFFFKIKPQTFFFFFEGRGYVCLCVVLCFFLVNFLKIVPAL